MRKNSENKSYVKPATLKSGNENSELLYIQDNQEMDIEPESLIAVEFGTSVSKFDEFTSISYARLNFILMSLADNLREHGVLENTYLVSLFSNNWLAFLAFHVSFAIHAVYIPLSVSFSNKNNSFALLMPNSDIAQIKISELGHDLVLITRMEGSSDKEPEYSHLDLAYIMHTSGTTRSGHGVPVRVPRRNLISNIKSLSSHIRTTTRNRLLQTTPPTFDPSIIEFLLPFYTNTTLIIPATTIPIVLTRILSVTSPTHLMTTPSFFALLPSIVQRNVVAGATSVHTLVLGGEMFPIHILKWARNIEIASLYGTTENSVWATISRISGITVSLGCVLDDTILEVRDDSGVAVRWDRKWFVREGVQAGIGNVWLGGDVRQCFVGETMESEEERLVRDTGDLAEFEVLDSGEVWVSVTGRVGNVVKVAGCKVSLEHVSRVVGGVEGVRQSEALFHQDEIHCFISLEKDSKQIDDHEIKELKLPSEMGKSITKLLETFITFQSRPNIANFHVLSHIPVNENGKANKLRLLKLLNNIVPEITEGMIDIIKSIIPGFVPDSHRYLVDFGMTSMDAIRLINIISKHK
ncbi:hypothetical protein HK096_006520, partial [Nowakowskiella sp. JEL0078]